MDATAEFFDNPPEERVSLKAANRQHKKAQRTTEKVRKTKRQYPEPLRPKNEKQSQYLDSLRTREQVFAIGGAGTGKTYLAARFAVKQLVEGNVEKIILTRPTVSRPEHRLGFLPGDDKKKMEPWLVPLVSAMKEEIHPEKIEEMLRKSLIEIVSFEHMRGRTFKDAFVLLDEAQNCTYADLRLFLTRIGEDSRVVISGDSDQVDIPNSGLASVVELVRVHNISADIIEFGPGDVVRSKLAKEWVEAFTNDSRY